MVELKGSEFHDDLRDIAAQGGVNIGLSSPKIGDQNRAETAAEHGLHVRPEQVKVQRIMYGDRNIHVRYTLAVK